MKRFAIRFNAPVVLSFAILSLLVLVLDSVTGGASTARLFCVYRAPLTDPLTYVRFFTHVLGHSGYSHYMGNMLLLLLVGPGLEEKYGSRNLLLTIVITALATGLVQFLLFPYSALLGASGVVFMMIVLSSFTEMKKGGIPLTMLLVAALYLGSEIADGLTKTDNVSHLTHIVGGVCGIVFGFRLARAASMPPSRYTAANTDSVASARMEGRHRPPPASSPLPSRSSLPSPRLWATSYRLSSHTRAARIRVRSPSGKSGCLWYR